MSKVIILVGLPASGKSTWAKEYCDTHEDYVRVNNDSIQLMLKSTWSKDLGSLISSILKDSITYALNKGYNVIVDNTNLSIHAIRAITDAINNSIIHEIVQTEYKYFLHVPIETCIERDSKRDNPVGEKRIREMQENYKNNLGELK